MFKALGGLNLGNFLIKKPLRWAFSQAFGSKMKVWFDDNVSVIIDAALMSGMFDPTSAILKFTDNEFIEKLLGQVVGDLNIPKQYQGLAKDYVKDKIKEQIKNSFDDQQINKDL